MSCARQAGTSVPGKIRKGGGRRGVMGGGQLEGQRNNAEEQKSGFSPL